MTIHYPGRSWETAAPSAEGVDPERLDAAMQALGAACGAQGTREALVIRGGRIIWQGPDVHTVHNVWSCTKVFTSTCVGLLMDDGRCTLETRACEAIPSLVERYHQVTLRHLATMTSGYSAAGDDPALGHGQSRTPFEPGEPLFPPGTRFLYWDSAMNLLALVLTRLAGRPLAELFRERVAEPIGMREWRWGVLDRVEGLEVNGGAGNMGEGVHISARDLARLGLLFRHGGTWAGRRLLSTHWVSEATRPQVPPTLPPYAPGKEGLGEYGYCWWTAGPGPSGTFYASGFNNNRCIVVPRWDLVLVRLGLDGNVSHDVYAQSLTAIGAAGAEADPRAEPQTREETPEE